MPVSLICTTFQTVLCWNNSCKCIINCILPSSPSCDVIVLPSPAPILVRKAVHFKVLLRSYSRHPSEVLRVWKPAVESEHDLVRHRGIRSSVSSSIIPSEVSRLPLQFNVSLYICIMGGWKTWTLVTKNADEAGVVITHCSELLCRIPYYLTMHWIIIWPAEFGKMCSIQLG